MEVISLKKRIILILSIFSIIISIGFLIYPCVSGFINQICNNSLVENYDKNVNTMPDDEIEEEFAAAYEYNNNIVNQITTDNKYSYDSTGAYAHILNFDDGQIGYIEIPKINVNLPIYHGINEKVLEKGAAHLPNTSLPLDGEDVHSVISAHTAYPAKVFFDNIEELENGDKFYITVLNKRFTYEVYRKDIVEPKDTSLLRVVKGENIVTLMTCYPYAVNSHRLLVRGKLVNVQIEENNNTITQSESSHNYKSLISTGLIILSFLIFIAIILIIIKKKLNKS